MGSTERTPGQHLGIDQFTLPLLGWRKCLATSARGRLPTCRCRKWSVCCPSRSRAGALSPTSTSSTRRLPRCSWRRASSARPRPGSAAASGVRVVAGERTGYAYTDDLSWAAMARAAETAAHIAQRLEGRCRRSPSRRPRSTGATARRAWACWRSPTGSRSWSARTAPRAAADPRIEKVFASLGEQTRTRADRELARRAGRGRAAALLDPRERHREREGRAARGLAPAAAAGSARSSSWRSRPSTSRARPRAWRSRCSAPSGAGRHDAGRAGAGLARDPAARGRRPRARGRLQPQGPVGLLRPDRRARGGARRDGGGRRHDRRPPRQPQRRRRGQPPRPHRADRGRHPARLPAGPHERRRS